MTAHTEGSGGMSTDPRTWDRRESGPPDAEQTVLCLPGGLCTAMFYES
jgi:hypothetical protein